MIIVRGRLPNLMKTVGHATSQRVFLDTVTFRKPFNADTTSEAQLECDWDYDGARKWAEHSSYLTDVRATEDVKIVIDKLQEFSSDVCLDRVAHVIVERNSFQVMHLWRHVKTDPLFVTFNINEYCRKLEYEAEKKRENQQHLGIGAGIAIVATTYIAMKLT